MCFRMSKTIDAVLLWLKLQRWNKDSMRAEILFTLSFLVFFAFVPFLERSPETDGARGGLGQPGLISGLNAAYLDETVPPKNVLSFVPYKVVEGDTVSEIAERYGLNQDSVISCNGIEKARHLQIGTILQIPNMDGLMHTIGPNDTLEKVAEHYKAPLDRIRQVNSITSLKDAPGTKLFVPEAKLPTIELRRVWGELFRYPTRGWISSSYGYREDPIYGTSRFHNGIDIANSTGTAVTAAMEGTIVDRGYNESAGNYVVMTHVGGYTTLYAHLDRVLVKVGKWVNEGEKIGEMGTTGYSTGPHLHFSIFRWGRSLNPTLLLH